MTRFKVNITELYQKGFFPANKTTTPPNFITLEGEPVKKHHCIGDGSTCLDDFHDTREPVEGECECKAFKCTKHNLSYTPQKDLVAPKSNCCDKCEAGTKYIRCIDELCPCHLSAEEAAERGRKGEVIGHKREEKDYTKDIFKGTTPPSKEEKCEGKCVGSLVVKGACTCYVKPMHEAWQKSMADLHRPSKQKTRYFHVGEAPLIEELTFHKDEALNEMFMFNKINELIRRENEQKYEMREPNDWRE